MKRLLLSAAALALLSTTLLTTTAHAIDEPTRQWMYDFNKEVLVDIVASMGKVGPYCKAVDIPHCYAAMILSTRNLQRGLAWMNQHPAPECIKYVASNLQKPLQGFLSAELDAIKAIEAMDMARLGRATDEHSQANNLFDIAGADFISSAKNCIAPPQPQPTTTAVLSARCGEQIQNHNATPQCKEEARLWSEGLKKNLADPAWRQHMIEQAEKNHWCVRAEGCDSKHTYGDAMKESLDKFPQ
jgi:hypothetical protein